MLRCQDTSNSPKNATHGSELLFELTISTLLSLKGNRNRVGPHDMLSLLLAHESVLFYWSPTCSGVKITAWSSHS